MGIDLSSYLAGGAAARPDSLTGLDPKFTMALDRLFSAAPPGLQIKSGFRSDELQGKLWTDALAKYGSPEAARHWVAPPGKSHHNSGTAVDLGFGNPAAEAWAHDNAGQFGLKFPMGHEPWHVELGDGAAAFPLDGVPQGAANTMPGGGLESLFTPEPIASPAPNPAANAQLAFDKKQALFNALPGLAGPRMSV